ncbi:MAG: response regulator [Pseudomonadota bacterium]
MVANTTKNTLSDWAAHQELHILLVEDEEAHVELISRSLGNHPQLKLDWHKTVSSARNYLQEKTPDLAVIDYLLPDGKGTDLVDMNCIKFPSIIMTSHGDERLAVEVMKAGAFDYVIKSDATLLDMNHVIGKVFREWNLILDKELEKRKLEEAHITLKNIIGQFEQEKNCIREDIALNVEKNALPVIAELRREGINSTKLDLLEYHLKNLSSDFYKKIINLKYNLTPSEIEICKLVKAGHPGKAIAELLSVSYLTVQCHKKNIRRKLKLNRTATNLVNFLNENL